MSGYTLRGAKHTRMETFASCCAKARDNVEADSPKGVHLMSHALRWVYLHPNKMVIIVAIALVIAIRSHPGELHGDVRGDERLLTAGCHGGQ